MDNLRDFAGALAAGILVPCGRITDPHSFGACRDRSVVQPDHRTQNSSLESTLERRTLGDAEGFVLGTERQIAPLTYESCSPILSILGAAISPHICGGESKMKKLSAFLAIPVLATGLAIGQDQPATSRDANNPPTANAENIPQTPQRHHQDYGWLGLFGLLGLLGLRRNRAYGDQSVPIDRGSNYAGSGDVRRVG